eukprot:6182820-Pyramimonas_sp.AAC.1
MAPVLSPPSSACPCSSSPFVAVAWSRLALGLEAVPGAPLASFRSRRCVVALICSAILLAWALGRSQ